eukprot:m.164337 g.164337  ORF g.164337 m.164337 type:complete len:572 (-) comp10312_c0_seq12:764-2479(-)
MRTTLPGTHRAVFSAADKGHHRGPAPAQGGTCCLLSGARLRWCCAVVQRAQSAQMTDLQKQVYTNLVASSDFQLVKRSGEPCDCESPSSSKRGRCCYQFISRPSQYPCTCPRESCRACHCAPGTDHVCQESVHWRTLMLPVFTTLQKVANHLGLIFPDRTHNAALQARDARICELAFGPDSDFLRMEKAASFMLMNDDEISGKMQVLRSLMVKWKAQKCKVLLFSYTTRLLDILEGQLKAQGTSYRRIDGKTSASQRLKLVDEFNTNSEISVSLISTLAGGVGLNLTGANIVVVFDPNWNPAHDFQAQDRAFRIGQQRDVRVYRLVAAGSIEELVYARQIYKQQIANIAQEGGSERPYFDGVQGSVEGELFGLKNLLSCDFERNLTKSTIQRLEQREVDCAVAEFGLKLPTSTGQNKLDAIGGGVNDDDEDVFDFRCVIGEELAGERDVGASLAAPEPPKRSAASELELAIFAAKGVSYAHANSDVVGQLSPLTNGDETDASDEDGPGTRTTPRQRRQRHSLSRSRSATSDGGGLPLALRKKHFTQMARRSVCLQPVAVAQRVQRSSHTWQ